MTTRSTSLVAGALFVLTTAPAHAQLAAACRGDVRRFCEGVPLGGGRVIRCLEENGAKLSAGCRKAMGIQEAPAGEAAGGNGASAGGAGAAKTACRSDAMRFCSEAIGDQTKMKA